MAAGSDPTQVLDEQSVHPAARSIEDKVSAELQLRSPPTLPAKAGYQLVPEESGPQEHHSSFIAVPRQMVGLFVVLLQDCSCSLKRFQPVANA